MCASICVHWLNELVLFNRKHKCATCSTMIRFTDLMEGPWLDDWQVKPSTASTRLQKVTKWIMTKKQAMLATMEIHVGPFRNVFDVWAAVDHMEDYDLVADVGLWRNLHDPTIVLRQRCAIATAVTDNDRRWEVQEAQCRVFGRKKGRDMMFVSQAALFAQTSASIVRIAPIDHVTGMKDSSTRPFVKAKLVKSEWAPYNYITGGYWGPFWVWYWPMTKKAWVEPSEDGEISVEDIYNKHKNVLVLATGLNRFWLRLMNQARGHTRKRLKTKTVVVALLFWRWQKMKGNSLKRMFVSSLCLIVMMWSPQRRRKMSRCWSDEQYRTWTMSYTDLRYQHDCTCLSTNGNANDAAFVCESCVRHIYGWATSTMREQAPLDDPEGVAVGGSG